MPRACNQFSYFKIWYSSKHDFSMVFPSVLEENFKSKLKVLCNVSVGTLGWEIKVDSLTKMYPNSKRMLTGMLKVFNIIFC